MDYLCYFCLVLFFLCFPGRLFIDALWWPAGGGAGLLALVCDV